VWLRRARPGQPSTPVSLRRTGRRGVRIAFEPTVLQADAGRSRLTRGAASLTDYWPERPRLAASKSANRGWPLRRPQELLAAYLGVEVPINRCPTRDPFAETLIDLGSLATSVELLCELDRGDEAMLLYD